MDTIQLLLRVLTLLVMIFILAVVIQGNIKQGKQIDQLSNQVHDINEYIVDLKRNWITIYSN